MLSDEEKQALKILESVRISLMNFNEVTEENVKVISSIKTIINLIEKQSKEIEELKEENRTQRKQLNDAFDRGWVHEDKIKAKIEEVSKGTFDAKIVLQSLLEKE